MSDMTKHHAALDAMVLGEQRVVSYRTLSSEMSIPTSEAQQSLREYIKLRSDKLLATWAVTSEHDSFCRLSLVKGNPPTVEDDVKAVSVWAVAPLSLPTASDGEAWIAADRTRELEMVRTAPSQANELKENKWNRLSSATAGWSVGGAAAQERERMEAVSREKQEVLKKKQSSGLLAKVKAEAADKRRKSGGGRNGGVNFSRPNSKNGGNGNAPLARPSTTDGSKPSSKPFRTLGDSLLKKQRPASAPSNAKNASTKKGRRVVVEESDDENESSADEADEETQERLAMEKEAAEAERRETERESVRKELEDLQDDGGSSDDFMDDLQAKIEDKKAKAKEKSKATSVLTPPVKKSKGKRELEDKMGEQAEPAKKKKKKYKAVISEVMEETADGYIQTKRITKYVDDDGNEKPEDEPLDVDRSDSEGKTLSSGVQNGKGPRKFGNESAKKSSTETKKRKSSTGKENSADENNEANENIADGEEKKGKRKAKGKKNTNKSILSFFSKK